MKTTIVILIDALGHELTERHGFRPAGVPYRARLETVLGFSQAALASIVTGLTPGEHSLWMMYSFSRGRSPFAWLSCLPHSVSARRLWLRRLMRWKLARIDRMRGYYSLYDVPREVLPHLDLPARRDIFAPGGAGKTETVLDALASRGMPFFVWDYHTPEARAFDELERSVRERRAGFYLLYTAGLDADLHGYGTTAPAIGAHLDWYGERIGRICAAARGAADANVLVFGDHGMCDVRERVDIMGRVGRLDLAVPGDYVPFYDATMARFRVGSPRAREALLGELAAAPLGHIMSPKEREALDVAFPDGRFGDIVFLADPGVIILPSYMGSQPVAAMHGYDPETPCMHSALFSNRELPAGEMSILDMAALMVPGFEAGERRESR